MHGGAAPFAASACAPPGRLTRNTFLATIGAMTNDARRGLVDTQPTLAAMKVCRDAMIVILRSYPPRHPIAREATWLMKDIDTLAGILTGDNELFHTKAHGGVPGRR